MATNKIQSVEPNIADLVNGWLKKYKLDYKLEQESLNESIDKALNEYFSKNGGAGGNRPDAKLLLQDKNLNYYPILTRRIADYGIKTIGDLLELSTKENIYYKERGIYNIRGVGKCKGRELIDYLHSLGFRFKDEIVNLDQNVSLEDL